MKKSLFLLIVLTICLKITAQKPAQSAYFEVLGPGFASFNFDTRFTKSQKGIGGRIGFGGFRIDGEGITTIPIGVNYLFGNDNKNYFELGVNTSIVTFSTEDEDGVFGSTFNTLNFGYRYQPLKSGVTFRVAINPIFTSKTFFPFYGGLSIGYKF